MSIKPRILFALESYPPDINGSGIATRRLAEGLAGRGYPVAVVCPGKSRKMVKSVEEKVQVFRLGSISTVLHKDYRFAPFAKKFIDEVFNEFKPTIVNVSDCFSTAGASFSKAKKLHIPVVGTNHFHPHNLLHYLKLKQNYMSYQLLEKLLWAYFRRMFNSILAVTVPTETASKIIRKIGIKTPIHVISNGIDLSLFKHKKLDSDIYKKYGMNPEKLILSSVGRVEKEKRLDVIVDAVAMIKDNDDFQLVIVGKGKEEKVLKKLAAKHGIQDKVILTGAVPLDDLYQLYEISDIFLSASEIELQGLSIMEAMAYALPVIAARSTAIPELIEDGENGYLFKPGDSKEVAKHIIKLVEDSKLREKMAKNSLAAIKKHDFQNILTEFEKFYEKYSKWSG